MTQSNGNTGGVALVAIDVASKQNAVLVQLPGGARKKLTVTSDLKGYRELAHYLKKLKNKACFYLKPDNRCSIYFKRPKVCRDFTCRTGWKLSSADAGRLKPSDQRKIQKSAQKRFMEKITPDARFTPVKDVRLKLCYYQPEKKKIFFIKHLKKG